VTDDYPETLEAAYALIDDLRERLSGFEAECSTDNHSLTAMERRIYGMIRKRGYVHKEALASAIYGTGDQLTEGLLRVHIHKIRRKLPESERIINVHGDGYKHEMTQAH